MIQNSHTEERLSLVNEIVVGAINLATVVIVGFLAMSVFAAV